MAQVVDDEALPSDDWIPADHGEVDTLEARGRRISTFSARSRARLMYRTSTLDFSELVGVPEMATFTYHEGWPADGQVVKAHFRAWLERFARRWGTRAQGVWKLEFQSRGAPHFHLYFARPVGSFVKFVAWAKRAWHEVTTGCVDEACEHPHAQRGFWLDRQFVSAVRSRGKVAGYFAKHGAHAAKSYQNVVPAGFENVGRFWGVLGLAVHTREVEVDVQTMLDVRRALAKLRRARSGRRAKVPGRLIGLWSMCGDGYRVLAQLLGLAVDVETGEVRERAGPASYGAWIRELDAATTRVPALV